MRGVGICEGGASPLSLSFLIAQRAGSRCCVIRVEDAIKSREGVYGCRSRKKGLLQF